MLAGALKKISIYPPCDVCTETQHYCVCRGVFLPSSNPQVLNKRPESPHHTEQDNKMTRKNKGTQKKEKTPSSLCHTGTGFFLWHKPKGLWPVDQTVLKNWAQSPWSPPEPALLFLRDAVGKLTRNAKEPFFGSNCMFWPPCLTYA